MRVFSLCPFIAGTILICTLAPSTCIKYDNENIRYICLIVCKLKLANIPSFKSTMIKLEQNYTCFFKEIKNNNSWLSVTSDCDCILAKLQLTLIMPTDTQDLYVRWQQHESELFRVIVLVT